MPDEKWDNIGSVAEFGAALRGLRGQKTQQSIAQHAQRNHFYLHRPDLSSIERGHRLPTANELRGILHGCGRVDLFDHLDCVRTRLSAPEALPSVKAAPPSRRLVWLIAPISLLIVVGAGAWIWFRENPPPPAIVIYGEPVKIESVGSGLWLALHEDPDPSGAAAVVVAFPGPAFGVWHIKDPHPAFQDSFQLHPQGRPTMCLEVFQESVAEDASVSQWDCNNRKHQHWKLTPTRSGALQIINLYSHKCLSTIEPQPRSGTRVVQQSCDADEAAQQWRTVPLPPGQ